MKRNTANTGGVATAAEKPVLLHVHLWTRSGETVPEQATTMLKDLLQVRGGHLQDASAGMVAASFGDALQAVNAGRNLQRMLQGFASEWRPGALGGVTTLQRLDDRDEADVAHLRESLGLERIHPGQLVFVGELCEQARAIAGLELMPCMGSKPMLLVGPPTRMEGYVDEPFVVRVVRVVEPAAVARTPVASPAPVAAITKPMGAVEGAAKLTVAGKSSAAIQKSAQALPASLGEEIIPASSGAKRWWVLGGVAAAGVAGLLLSSPFFKKATPVLVPVVQHAEPGANAGQKQVNPGIPAVGADVVKPQPPARQVDIGGKRRSGDAAMEKAPAHSDEVASPPVQPTHGISFNAAEIASLIAHADKDSGDGNFEKAIREYRIVLRQEPGNEMAKRGLARALRNQGAQE